MQGREGTCVPTRPEGGLAHLGVTPFHLEAGEGAGASCAQPYQRRSGQHVDNYLISKLIDGLQRARKVTHDGLSLLLAARVKDNAGGRSPLPLALCRG